jgi:DNA mismatch repair protein MutS
LRHPIIERILTQEEYIPNDVQLGGSFSSGILLYGVNSSGKSSLSKAVALAIIMAQVGMFVPANLTYWPYRQIFTRIPSGDDIIKGKSTFIIEISEMGNILKRATPNSLVIGDELASGTESISALSIVGAGITQLCTRNTSFIFATHLHDLTSISQVKLLIESATLSIFHLAVEYDASRDCLIYQRTLARGQGASIYGLEVCKALNLDTQFMNIANEIRHEVLGESANLVKQKKSRYNAAVFVDSCKLCGAKAQEVHHIKPQELADLAGYIGAIHKNHRANLIAICEKCHNAIHAGKIKVDGFRQTTAGIQLITHAVASSSSM